MDNWVLVAMIVAVNDLVIAFLFVAYNGSRMYDENRRCAERIEAANAEVLAMRRMRRTTEIQARTYGAVPISRLIGGDDASGR